ANSLRTASYLGLALTLLTLGAAAVFPGVLGEIPLPLLLPATLCIPFQLLVLFGLNLLVGLGRVPLFNALELIFRGAGVAGLFVILILLRGDVRWVLILNLIIAAGAAVAVVRILGGMVRRSGTGESRTSLALFRSSVGYGAKAYVAALLAYLIVRSDMLLVNMLRGTSDAGVYSIAVQITDLIYLLPMSIGLVLFPRLTRHHEGDPVFAMKVARHTAFLMLVLCAAAALLAHPVIKLLYGESFLPAVRALWWLLPGIWAYGVCNQVATQLASSGMPLPAVLVWVPPLVLNLILNLAWIPRWGIQGAAASSSVAYFLVLALHLYLLKRRIRGTWADALILRRSDLKEMRASAGIESWS
ncbi:MAG: polysaccharide biosynthesis C-terminal domain-containing protein, partial [Acidobacteria bacterium]|nr:polysaccharide biosynthesis C-terminal domain-containing protein [Acidobacteriota bacterium]